MEDRKVALTAERAEIREEIERLEKTRAGLGLVLDEFDHEYRRARDALERQGGRAPNVESRLKSLGQNQRLTEKDIGQAENRLTLLRRHLAAIESELNRFE